MREMFYVAVDGRTQPGLRWTRSCAETEVSRLRSASPKARVAMVAVA